VQVSLNSPNFTIPANQLWQAFLILDADRTLAGQHRPAAAPQGAVLEQIEHDAEVLGSSLHGSPSSEFAGVLGDLNQHRAPSVSDFDQFFAAAWADGSLSEGDLSNPLLTL